MTDTHRLKVNAIDQLSELSEMAHRGRSSIINAGPMMLIWGSAIIVAALCERLSQRSAYTVAAWIVPILVAFVSSLVAIRAARRDGRAVTWRSRAIYRVWVAAGAAIVVFNVGEELRRAGMQSESEAATALILAVRSWRLLNSRTESPFYTRALPGYSLRRPCSSSPTPPRF